MPQVRLRFSWKDTPRGELLSYNIEEGGVKSDSALTGYSQFPSNWPVEFEEYVRDVNGNLEENVPKDSDAVVRFDGFDDRDPEIELQ